MNCKTTHHAGCECHERLWHNRLNTERHDLIIARTQISYYRKALELIAASERSDGTYNRDRKACELTAKKDQPSNPPGPSTGSYRVIRGGGWYNVARFARSANRNSFSPGDRYDYLGLRLVRTRNA